MTKLTTPALRKTVLSMIEARGRLTSKESLQEVFAALGLKLQEGYKGALVTMMPTTAPTHPEQKFAHWAELFTFKVLEVCERHSRTETQVMAALEAVLAG